MSRSQRWAMNFSSGLPSRTISTLWGLLASWITQPFCQHPSLPSFSTAIPFWGWGVIKPSAAATASPVAAAGSTGGVFNPPPPYACVKEEKGEKPFISYVREGFFPFSPFITPSGGRGLAGVNRPDGRPPCSAGSLWPTFSISPLASSCCRQRFALFPCRFRWLASSTPDTWKPPNSHLSAM